MYTHMQIIISYYPCPSIGAGVRALAVWRGVDDTHRPLVVMWLPSPLLDTTINANADTSTNTRPRADANAR